jgi:hypothetical protein
VAKDSAESDEAKDSSTTVVQAAGGVLLGEPTAIW